MDLTTLDRGDPVRVFDRLAPGKELHGGPEGGYGGIVDSVGRKYLVIKFRKATSGPEHEIRVDQSSGQSPDTGRRWTVLPAGEANRLLARSNDIGMLRAAGLYFTSSGREQLMDDELLHKLAEMVEPFVLSGDAEANG